MNNRYDFSRLRAFQLCPKKHDYIYNQGLRSAGGMFVKVGSLFHQCLEGHYNDDDAMIQKALEEFKGLVLTGVFDLDVDLLEYVYSRYLMFYKDTEKGERLIANEVKIEEELESGDIFHLTADRVVEDEKTGMIVLRDTKTTLKKLKYSLEDVQYNMQLLTYVPFIEEKYSCKIDAIQIDEVRMCKMLPTPLNLNGKPTADKGRLEFTTFEDYRNELAKQGLLDAKEYQNALQYMEGRGHPMFRRTTAQLLDSSLVQSNMKDVYNTYEAVRSTQTTFRNRGPLCNYCDYKELCKMDTYDADEALRQIEINKITEGKKEEED